MSYREVPDGWLEFSDAFISGGSVVGDLFVGQSSATITGGSIGGDVILQPGRATERSSRRLVRLSFWPPCSGSSSSGVGRPSRSRFV